MLSSHFPQLLSRRAITGVLVLWLCVIASGIWAPMARADMAAHSVERLCSGAPLPQWAESPTASTTQADAALLHHLMECPLCLPVLAPPPNVQTLQAYTPPQQLVPERGATPAQTLAQQWPPARGPPSNISIL